MLDGGQTGGSPEPLVPNRLLEHWVPKRLPLMEHSVSLTNRWSVSLPSNAESGIPKASVLASVPLLEICITLVVHLTTASSPPCCHGIIVRSSLSLTFARSAGTADIIRGSPAAFINDDSSPLFLI
ncbi:hypothetical protein HAX54_017545 [Datura stramonium]|uniref:Uncharacterized protein n=1 Tax=Datura stramonium TaxID=4076 RepID=A0ABS8UL54_DATST|nr:hypothetical protein [Datura stramonium]